MSWKQPDRGNPYQTFLPGEGNDAGFVVPHGGGGAGGGSEELLARILKALQEGIKISESPRHMDAPITAQTIDIKNVFSIGPGLSQEIIRFVAPPGGSTWITHYAIFNDGLLASDFDFIPRVDGRRIYSYHGDPLDNFRIYLGVNATIDNTALIPGLISMQPGQVLTWEAINNSAVDTNMAVRVVGYFDRTQIRTQERFGG